MKVAVEKPRKRSWSMNKTLELLTRIRSFATSTLLWLVLLFAIYVVIDELTTSTFVVEPISVPDSLAANGYTPDTVASWIVDEMYEIQTNTATRKELNSLSADAAQPDIEIPGSSISIKALSRLIRKALGIPERKISGELAELNDGRYRLHLRVNTPGEQTSVISAEGGIEALITAAAEGAMETIDPYLLAAHYYAALTEDTEMLSFDDPRLTTLNQLIELSFTNGDADDDAWGLNLRGAVLAGAKKHIEAVSYYRRALEVDQEFGSAHWNWSDSLISLRQYEEALTRYRAAVKLDNELPAHDFGLPIRMTVNALEDNKPEIAIQVFDEAVQSLARYEQIGSTWRSQHAWMLDTAAGAFFEFVRDHTPLTANEDPSLLVKCNTLMITALEKALELTPTDPSLLVSLGEKHSYQGDFEKARGNYRAALSLDSERIQESSASACRRWNDDLSESATEPEKAEFDLICAWWAAS